MKIIMFGHKQMPSRAGGVEVAVTELSKRMVQRGHSVLCLNRGGKAGTYQGVVIRGLPTLKRTGIGAVVSSFWAAVYSAVCTCDCVHIHAEGPAFFSFIPKITGKRVVVTIHGRDWQRQRWQGTLGTWFLKVGEKMAVRYADQIIVLSRNMQEVFRKTYGRETVYLPNGIPDIPETGALSVPDLEKDSYLLFLGRLVPEKGIHTLIRAFAAVQTDKKLVIAGGSSDSAGYVAQLQELARKDERVQLLGPVEEPLLWQLYRNAYVYVLPSELEGMPLTLLEAIRCGCCCVVSDIPECTEVLQNRGAAISVGDIGALTQCLQKLCQDPDAVAQYRAAASACSLPHWDRVTEETLAVYQGEKP